MLICVDSLGGPKGLRDMQKRRTEFLNSLDEPERRRRPPDGSSQSQEHGSQVHSEDTQSTQDEVSQQKPLRGCM